MNKVLVASLALLTIIAACGGKTPHDSRPPEPATATETVTQPTQLSAPTDTPLPSPTIHTPETETPTEASVANVSFTNDVLPIFENHCTKCHGVEQIKEGLDLRTYEGLMAGSFNGTVITPGNAEDSFLVQQLLDGEMPKRGPKLTIEQIQIIISWVNAGALNN
jgi:mono/diheme cytochrome c family protein